jgi:hypothetical protein
MARFDQQIGMRRDEAGTLIADLNAKIAGQNEETAQITATTVQPPILDNTFTPIYTPAKKQRMFVTLRFVSFGTAREIKVVLIPRALVVDQATYDNARFSTKLSNEITDDSIAVQSVTSPLDAPLDPLTQYDVIRLVGINGDDRAANPTDDPTYAGYPGNIIYTFTTPAAAPDAGQPSKPKNTRVIGNTVDPNSDGSLSIVTLRVFADETEAKTCAQQNTVAMQAVVKDAAGDLAASPTKNVEDPTATSLDFVISGLYTGFPYTWAKNWASDASGQAVSSAAGSVDFVAGGYADPSDSLANLTLVSVTSTATEDPAALLVTFTLHQPDPAYKLKNYTAKRKVSANPDSDYDLAKNLVIDRGDLRDPTYSTAGNIDITFLMNVKASRIYKTKILVRSILGFTKEFESGDISISGITIPAAASAQGGGASLIVGGSLQASVKDDDDLYNPPGAGGDSIYPMRLWQTVSNSGTKIDNKASGGGGTFDSKGVRWDNTNARLECATNIVTLGGRPATRIGKLFHKNDVVVLCPSFLSAVADITVDVSFALVDQVGGDIVVATATAFPISHTTERRGLWILVVPSVYVGTAKQWVEMRFGSNPAQKVYTWNWQLDYGEVYRDFKINADEKAVLDFLDTPPVNTAISASGLITESANGDRFSKDGTTAGPIYLLA